MTERKLFCLIRQSDNERAIEEETLMKYNCPCGWPDQPCIEMQPDMRTPPVMTSVSRFYMPAWQAPWNKRKVPVRHPRS